MSDVERNIGVVRRLEAAYNEADYDTVRSLVAADFTPHTPGSQMLPPGVEGAVAANDGAIDTDWIQISRNADDGRIVETWAQMDTPKMMMQAGMQMPGM